MQRNQENKERSAEQLQETIDRRRVELVAFSRESTGFKFTEKVRQFQERGTTATVPKVHIRFEQHLQQLNQERQNQKHVSGIFDQLSSTAAAAGSGTGIDLKSRSTMGIADHKYSRGYSVLKLQQKDMQQLRLATALIALQNERNTSSGSLLLQNQAHQLLNTSNNSFAKTSSDDFQSIENAKLAHLLSTAQQNPSSTIGGRTLSRTTLQGRHEVQSLLLQHQLHQKKLQRLLSESKLRGRAQLQLAHLELLKTTKRDLMIAQQRTNRRKSIEDHNRSMAGSLSSDALSKYYQDLRLCPTSLLQNRDIITPTNRGGKLCDPIVVEGGISGYFRRRRLNSSIHVGKSEDFLPQKKRVKLAPREFISGTDRSKLFQNIPLPSTFPLPGLNEKQELKLDINCTAFGTFRKLWESASERSNNNPTLQKQLFQRMLSEQRLFYADKIV